VSNLTPPPPGSPSSRRVRPDEFVKSLTVDGAQVLTIVLDQLDLTEDQVNEIEDAIKQAVATKLVGIAYSTKPLSEVDLAGLPGGGLAGLAFVGGGDGEIIKNLLPD
jgi:hypothetical protein